MCKSNKNERRVVAVESLFRSFVIARDINDSEIKFEEPINFNEIKILPSAKYYTDDTGGLMVGATNPSQFLVNFLCNDISCPDSTEYEELGSIDYNENSCTHLLCSSSVFSNKLIVRGRFRAITVIVYGSPRNPNVENVQKMQPYTLPHFPVDPSVVGHAILPLADDFDQDIDFGRLPLPLISLDPEIPN